MDQKNKRPNIKLALCNGQLCIDARMAHDLLGEYEYRRRALSNQIVSLPGRGGLVSLSRSDHQVSARIISRLCWEVLQLTEDETIEIIIE